MSEYLYIFVLETVRSVEVGSGISIFFYNWILTGFLKPSFWNCSILSPRVAEKIAVLLCLGRCSRILVSSSLYSKSTNRSASSKVRTSNCFSPSLNYWFSIISFNWKLLLSTFPGVPIVTFAPFSKNFYWSCVVFVPPINKLQDILKWSPNYLAI